MVSPNQLSSWRPDTLRDISDDIARRRKALLEQSDELESAKVPTSSYSFESAQPAQRAHDNLASTLATQISEATAIIKALDAAASSIDSAKRSLEGAYSMTRSSPLSINGETGYVSVTRTAKDSSDAQYLYTQRNYAQQFVDDALSTAAAADEALTKALTTATTSDVNSVGTLDQQRKIMEFLERSPAGQVDYLMKHPDEYALMGDHLSPEVKERLGNQVASEFDELARNQRLLGDTKEVARCTSLLEAFGDDAVVMSTMYSKLEPEGLLATFNGITSTMTIDSWQHDELAKLSDELRSGLQVASTDPDFDGKAYGRELVRYSTCDVTRAESSAYHDKYGVSPTTGAGVLDYLLRKGEYGDDFVRGVAWQMDEFEREDPFAAELWSTHDTNSSPLRYLDGAGGDYQPDPMASVMKQLGHNTDVGLEFFTEGDQADDRCKYYFATRDWGRDDFAAISETALAIGTDPENLEHSRRSTGMFVSEYFDKISDNKHFTADEAGGAVESTAKLLKSYMPAVDAAVSAGAMKADPGVQNLDLNPYAPKLLDYPKMDQSDLDKLLDVALSNDKGTARVAEGVAALRQQQLAVYAHENPGFLDPAKPNNDVQLILERTAKLEGYVQHSVADSAVGDAKEKDEQVAVFTGLVSDAVGLIPAGKLVEGVGSEIVSGVWDAAWSRASEMPTDAITETWGNTAEATVAKENTKALYGNDGVQIRTAHALAQAGLIDIPSQAESRWMHGGAYVNPAEIKMDTWQQYVLDSQAMTGRVLDVSDISTCYGDPFKEWVTK